MCILNKKLKAFLCFILIGDKIIILYSQYLTNKENTCLSVYCILLKMC